VIVLINIFNMRQPLDIMWTHVLLDDNSYVDS